LHTTTEPPEGQPDIGCVEIPVLNILQIEAIRCACHALTPQTGRKAMTRLRPLPQPPRRAAYYRQRALEFRDLARAMTDASLQIRMLKIAEEYARLANRAETSERDYPKLD
jgi:hypothetical protein